MQTNNCLFILLTLMNSKLTSSVQTLKTWNGVNHMEQSTTHSINLMPNSDPTNCSCSFTSSSQDLQPKAAKFLGWIWSLTTHDWAIYQLWIIHFTERRPSRINLAFIIRANELKMCGHIIALKSSFKRDVCRAYSVIAEVIPDEMWDLRIFCQPIQISIPGESIPRGILDWEKVELLKSKRLKLFEVQGFQMRLLAKKDALQR